MLTRKFKLEGKAEGKESEEDQREGSGELDGMGVSVLKLGRMAEYLDTPVCSQEHYLAKDL